MCNRTFGIVWFYYYFCSSIPIGIDRYGKQQACNLPVISKRFVVINLCSTKHEKMAKLYNRVNSDELKRQLLESDETRVTLSFYQYHHIKDPQIFRDQIYKDWSALGSLDVFMFLMKGSMDKFLFPQISLILLKK